MFDKLLPNLVTIRSYVYSICSESSENNNNTYWYSVIFEHQFVSLTCTTIKGIVKPILKMTELTKNKR